MKQGGTWLTKWGDPYYTDYADQMTTDMQSIRAVSIYRSSSYSAPYWSGLKLQSNLGTWTCVGICSSTEVLVDTVSPGGSLYYISVGFGNFDDGYDTYTRPFSLTLAFTC